MLFHHEKHCFRVKNRKKMKKIAKKVFSGLDYYRKVEYN